jgi:Ca2+-transporting ATPase
VITEIHTKVRGRTRIHVTGLYQSGQLKALLEEKLGGQPAIFNLSISTTTGNLLVYHEATFHWREIAALIEEILKEAGLGAEKKKATAVQRPKTAPVSRPSVEKANRKQQVLKKMKTLLPFGTEQIVEPWHILDGPTVLNRLEAWPDGLSSEMAQIRLKKYGANALPEADSRSGWKIFLDQLNSLPVYLLGAAAGVSVLTGGLLDATIVMGVVVANAVIGYFTESEAEKTIHSLKSMIQPVACVLRDGKARELPAENLVVGDILILKPGSYVAADCRILAALRLTIDESALTGESMPVAKSTAELSVENTPLADRTNMAYMGTVVTGGQGRAVVVATSRFTEIGRLQMLMATTTTPKTPIERQLEQIGNQLVLLCGGVCGLVFFLGFWRGYGLLQMMQMAISLAAAAVPEGLPTAATINFSLGIENMKKHHVLARHLQAIETLGAVQTLCLDKTGTITQNQMCVTRLYCGMRRIDVKDDVFSVNREPIDPMSLREVRELAGVCVLCTETKINGTSEIKGKTDVRSDRYELIGSATENALLQMAINSGLDAMQLRADHRLDTLDYRAENRHFMKTIHIAPGGRGILSIKGSPPEVLAMCRLQLKDNQVIPLSEDDKQRIEIENQRMAGDALRVLGFACAIDETGETAKMPPEMIWLGLAGMQDPVREGVRKLIHTLHQAGIDTIMITGDQSSTAYSVATQIDIAGEKPLEILDSAELTAIDSDVLEALSEKISVFSRVSPAHKLKIVQALQAAGRTVAMTGDGINDGPALKASDIGIAMGRSGTDVAREVADVVLEEDNLDTLVQAIQDGRAINANIRKSVHFFLSTNFSEIMIMLSAMGLGFGVPLNVMQLLWINIISDIFPGLALSMEEPEADVMETGPRNADEPIFSADDYKRMLFESANITGGALGAYGYGILRYGMGAGAASLAFQSLTIGQLLHAYSCRSESVTLLNRRKAPANRYLDVAVGGSLVLQGLTMFFSPLRSLLGLKAMNLTDVAITGASAVLPLIINESTKKTGH